MIMDAMHQIADPTQEFVPLMLTVKDVQMSNGSESRRAKERVVLPGTTVTSPRRSAMHAMVD